MFGYCLAVYLIRNFLLYAHVSNSTLFRQAEVNSELRVNEASEVRTDYLQHCL